MGRRKSEILFRIVAFRVLVVLASSVIPCLSGSCPYHTCLAAAAHVAFSHGAGD